METSKTADKQLCQSGGYNQQQCICGIPQFCEFGLHTLSFSNQSEIYIAHSWVGVTTGTRSVHTRKSVFMNHIEALLFDVNPIQTLNFAPRTLKVYNFVLTFKQKPPNFVTLSGDKNLFEVNLI